MAIDLSAGVTQPKIDLSAGLSSGIDLSAGLVSSPQPEHDSGARFSMGTGSVSVHHPSAWERIRSLFDSRPVEQGLGTTPLTEAIGNLIPQSTVPALSAAKRYAVDPLDRAAAKGGEFGGEVGEALASEAIQPYFIDKPKDQLSIEQLREKYPVTMGAAKGAGEVAGSTLADPRNWPFFASSSARPLLQRLIARGFATQMSAQTYQGAKELYDRWDRLTPNQRAEIGAKTGVGALFLSKGLLEGAKPPQTPHVVTSPIEVLHEPVPEVRVAESGAAARDLVERDTIHPQKADSPVTPPPGAFPRGKAPADWRVEEVRDEHGNIYSVVPEGVKTGWTGLGPNSGLPRGFTIDSSGSLFTVKDAAGKNFAIGDSFQDAINTAKERLAHGLNEPEEAEASVTGPRDVAELRKPTARIVNDSHIPVVTPNEVLADVVQKMVGNSDELLRAGIDPSKIATPADAEAMLQQAADHVARNIDPRTATITFEAQRALAESLGMTTEDLLSRKSGEAFNAEHAIAARALLNDSGLNVVKAAQSAMADPAAMPEMTRALARHQAILDAVKGMTAESGRALGSFKMQDLPASRIADAMSKLPEDAQAEAAKLLSKIDVGNERHVNEFIQQITPSSTADKIFEYYRNALLSGPATVIKKGVSEGTMLALELTKKVVSAGLSKAKGGEQQRYAAESWWFAKGAIDGLQHIGPVLRGELDLADAPEFEPTRQRAIKGKIGDVVRFPSTVLSRQTNLMYVMNWYGELNAQAARVAIGEGLDGTELAARQEYLVQHPTADMTKAANSVALENTFQKELGKFGKKVQSAVQADPTGALKYIIPFFKTPINIAKEGAYFSPYGLFKGTATGDVDMQARGLVGSALAAGIAYLALNGHVTGGGPIDPRKRETLEATGWMPYSLHLGGRYIQYRKLEPVGASLALVADAVHSMASGDPEVVAQSKADNAVAHVARSLQDVSFLPTLNNLAEALTNPGARAKNFISRQVASFIPAGVKDIAQATDRTVRRPTGIAETLESRIPGLTQNVPAVVDIAGQRVQRPVSAFGGANPFPVSTSKGDPVLDELARLGVGTSQPPTKLKWRGRDVELTPQERERFAREEGAAFIERARKVMQSGAWNKRNDDQKRQALIRVHKLIDESRAQRLTRMRREKTQ